MTFNYISKNNTIQYQCIYLCSEVLDVKLSQTNSNGHLHLKPQAVDFSCVHSPFSFTPHTLCGGVKLKKQQDFLVKDVINKNTCKPNIDDMLLIWPLEGELKPVHDEFSTCSARQFSNCLYGTVWINIDL